MTGYLLDTNVVSVLSPSQSGLAANRPAIDWLRVHEGKARLSVVTIMEIESGIRRLAASGSTRKAPQLEVWFARLIDGFADRFIGIDERIARTAGQLDALGRIRGRNPGTADILVAATAIVEGLTVVTRNVRHFAAAGVAVIDPFESLPEGHP